MDKDNAIEKDLISIGIPFYNSEKYLADAIKSVIKQTYDDWELILIDDGSIDASLKIAKEFEKKDKRISVVSDGKNLGLPKRLNQLSKLSKGFYYARMDADDIMHPERLITQKKYLDTHPEIDLLGTGLIAIDNDNTITGLRKGSFLDKIGLKMVIQMAWCVHPTITGKRNWFIENPYDESLRRAQDYELWIRTVEHSKFVKLEEPFLFYREASTPSLNKYFDSTKYTLSTFVKNRNRIGYFNLIKLSLNKIFKLMVYFLFSITGQTDKLIQRRSLLMNEGDTKKYTIILNNIVS